MKLHHREPDVLKPVTGDLPRTFSTAELLTSDAVRERLVELEEDLGASVYTEALYLLGALRLGPALAKRHWNRLLEHQREMSRRLDREVDVRIAAAEYLLALNREEDEPSPIELRVARQATDATRDSLTGLVAAGHFRRVLEDLVERARVERQRLALAILSVDHLESSFAPHSSTCEPANADWIFRALSWILVGQLRSTDVLARYGENAFAIVLPGANRKDALSTCERLLLAIQNDFALVPELDNSGELGFSIGLAAFELDGDNAKDLLAAAEEALFRSRSLGGGQVSSSTVEKRGEPRFEIAVEGELQSLAAPRPLSTVNLSLSGLRFRTDSGLSTGEIFRFQLSPGAARQRIEGVAEVRRSESAADGFSIAAEIIHMREESREALRDLLDGAKR